MFEGSGNMKAPGVKKSARVFMHPAVTQNPPLMERFTAGMEARGYAIGDNWNGGIGVGPAFGHNAHELMRSITMTPEGNLCMFNWANDAFLFNQVTKKMTRLEFTSDGPKEVA